MEAATVPDHVAIIMDGNGRWASQKGLPRTLGHTEGIKTLRQTIKDAYAIGIKYLTVYVFSTENWSRPKDEVSFLMKTLNSLIAKEVKELHSREVKVRFLGNMSELPPALLKKIQWAEELTAQNKRMQLNLLVNYGGRQEILQAVNQLITNNETPITENSLQQHLYTHDSPDPDLIIRTGGDLRLSNFLLWQAAYSEIWVTPICWPDFNKSVLLEALADFEKRDRRFGGLNA